MTQSLKAYFQICKFELSIVFYSHKRREDAKILPKKNFSKLKFKKVKDKLLGMYDNLMDVKQGIEVESLKLLNTSNNDFEGNVLSFQIDLERKSDNTSFKAK